MQSYEFDESQNGLIKDLAKKMQFVGYFSMTIGSLVFLVGLLTLAKGSLGTIISGVVGIIVGIWTLDAAKAFRLIVDTQGNDIENLMGALGELRKFYTLQYWLLVLTLVLLALGIIATIFLGSIVHLR